MLQKPFPVLQSGLARPNAYHNLNASKTSHIKTKLSHCQFYQHLDLDGRLKSLALLLSTCVGLGSHDTTTPVSLGLLILLGVALLDGRDELGELSLVLGSDLGESDNSSSLCFY